MDFKIIGQESLRTCIATIGNTVVIEAGDMIEASSGLAVKGTASGAKLAYSPFAHASGDGTQIELTVGNDFVLECAIAENVYAVSQNGTEIDLVVDTAVQELDNNASTTDVFVVCMAQPDAVVGAKTGIRVVINKPLY
jgi:hypothetical protein